MANVNKKLQQELAKAAHAFNEKIRYHESKGIEFLPERVQARTLKKELKTATDYQREINRLRRFGERGAEKPVNIGMQDSITITKWEKQDVQRQLKNINDRRARKLKEIQEIDVTVHGEKAGYKRGSMPSFREADLMPKKLNWQRFRSKKELDLYLETLENQRMSTYFEKRAQLFKDNYIQALTEKYGSKQVKELIKHIKTIEPKEVERLYYQEHDATINYVYTDTDEEQAKLKNLYNIWGLPGQPEEIETFDL